MRGTAIGLLVVALGLFQFTGWLWFAPVGGGCGPSLLTTDPAAEEFSPVDTPCDGQTGVRTWIGAVTLLAGIVAVGFAAASFNWWDMAEARARFEPDVESDP